MPYLPVAVREAHMHSQQRLRAMALEFPDDPACAYWEMQYMLGPALLVAPIFTEDGVLLQPAAVDASGARARLGLPGFDHSIGTE